MGEDEAGVVEARWEGRMGVVGGGGGGWSRLMESGKPSEDDAVAVQYELTAGS